MWIRSQNGEELLKVERFRSATKDNGDVNILAKLDRETVILGTYGKEQADEIMLHLWFLVGNDDFYAMPVRWEEEKE